MSTIEKAAERLAARQKGKSRQLRSSTEVALAESESAVRPVPQVPRPGLRSIMPATCEIDLEALARKGFITPREGRSQLAHEMRRIKRPLLLNIQKSRAKHEAGPPLNLIMVTSALPNEGKTFVSINLAMSLAAEVDRRVLLVDADLAKGDVSRQLGLSGVRGLSDLLHGADYVAEDAVLGCNVERLSVLPAGEPTEHVDELFASELMGMLARSLAEEDPNRLIVFDASPLLVTTEAAVLAQLMGQTVLVVEANSTPQDAVKQAVGQLKGCANVSLLLNKITGRASGTHGYGYGYGYGAADQNTQTSEGA